MPREFWKGMHMYKWSRVFFFAQVECLFIGFLLFEIGTVFFFFALFYSLIPFFLHCLERRSITVL
jgi:hypothetical protein